MFERSTQEPSNLAPGLAAGEIGITIFLAAIGEQGLLITNTIATMLLGMAYFSRKMNGGQPVEKTIGNWLKNLKK